MKTNRNPVSAKLQSEYQFCSFILASYDIKVVRVNKKSAHIDISAEIKIRTHSSGIPVIELGVDLIEFAKNPNLLHARVDGDAVGCETISFNGDRGIPLIAPGKVVPPGLHTLNFEYQLGDMVASRHAVRVTEAEGLFLRFTMSDLDERGSQFLGQYLPSNLAFDRYRMEFNVYVASRQNTYRLITNDGEATRIGRKNHWRFQTPGTYKSSYPWLHLFPEGTHVQYQKTLSLGNKTVEATVYGSVEEFDNHRPRVRISRLLEKYMREIIRYLQHFNRRYGEFPTRSLTVLMRTHSPGRGNEIVPNPVNMEYAGAVSASIFYLKHEICHCYFGRCISPINGDASWFDEAVASWEDQNTPSLEQAPQYQGGFLSSSELDRRMISQRSRDRLVAYHEGMTVISHLDYLLQEKGGMTAFLRFLLDRKKWMTVSNQDVADLLNQFAPELAVGNRFIRIVNGTPPYAPHRS